MNISVSDFVEHADKATALLKRAVPMHGAEMAGQIVPEEAMEIALDLNDRAIEEVDKALAAFSGGEPDND